MGAFTKLLGILGKGKKAAPTLGALFSDVSGSKAPGLLSRVLRKGGGTGGIRWGALAGTALGGGLLGNRLGWFDNEPVTPLTGEQINAALGQAPNSRAMIDDYINSQIRQLPSIYDTSGMRTRAEQNLQNYLAAMQGYANTQGAAINQAYSGLASESQQAAQQAAQQSQMMATDIDRLYGTAAANAAAYGAGQGLTTGGSDVSGMTGAYGSMAEMPDTTRTYGQSLADYMGRQGIISRQDLEAAAQSYLAQGIGTQAQLGAQAQGLGAQAQYNLQNRLMEIEAQNQQALAQERARLEAQRGGAILEQEVADAERSRQAGIAALQAPRLWETIRSDDGMEAMWNALGVTDAQSLYNALMADPRLVDLLVGI